MHLMGSMLTGTTPTTTGGNGLGLDPFSGNDLPGTALLGRLGDGVGLWALIAAMLGIVVGAVIWGFGHYSQNYQQSYNGRKGVLVCGLAAVLIGAAPRVVHDFYTLGTGVR